MSNEIRYATVSWVAEDVQTLRPNWTKEEAEDFLSANSRRIQDGVIEHGWRVIEALIGEDEE
jgi:hypothetical protein